MQLQSGNNAASQLIHSLGTRWGQVVNATTRPLYPQKEAPVQVVEEGRGGGPQGRSGRVWSSKPGSSGSW